MAFLGPAISAGIGAVTSLFTGGCGPSAEEKQQMNQAASIEQDITTAFNQRLAAQKETIGQLNVALSNVAAGKFPPGMDATTLASFTSKALTTTSRAYQQAAAAAQGAIAGRGGGAGDSGGLLSGTEAQVIGDVAAKGAATESDLLAQVQYENWQTGREDYMNYITGLTKMAELQNPDPLASAMIDANKQAFDTAQSVHQEQSQKAADIGTAVSNVASSVGAGLTAMTAQQQAKSSTRAQANRSLIGGTPGIPPGSIDLNNTDITPTPQIGELPLNAQASPELMGGV
jgi:hypothetical protein